MAKAKSGLMHQMREELKKEKMLREEAVREIMFQHRATAELRQSLEQKILLLTRAHEDMMLRAVIQHGTYNAPADSWSMQLDKLAGKPMQLVIDKGDNGSVILTAEPVKAEDE